MCILIIVCPEVGLNLPFRKGTFICRLRIFSVQSLMLFLAHLLHVFKCNEVSKAALVADTMSSFLFGVNTRPRWPNHKLNAVTSHALH